jgi:hypothetical protein
VLFTTHFPARKLVIDQTIASRRRSRFQRAKKAFGTVEKVISWNALEFELCSKKLQTVTWHLKEGSTAMNHRTSTESGIGTKPDSCAGRFNNSQRCDGDENPRPERESQSRKQNSLTTSTDEGRTIDANDKPQSNADDLIRTTSESTANGEIASLLPSPTDFTDKGRMIDSRQTQAANARSGMEANSETRPFQATRNPRSSDHQEVSLTMESLSL